MCFEAVQGGFLVPAEVPATYQALVRWAEAARKAKHPVAPIFDRWVESFRVVPQKLGAELREIASGLADDNRLWLALVEVKVPEGMSALPGVVFNAGPGLAYQLREADGKVLGEAKIAWVPVAGILGGESRVLLCTVELPRAPRAGSVVECALTWQGKTLSKVLRMAVL